MIRGFFNERGQAVIDGLLSFRLDVKGERPEIPVRFVLDTGSDVTMLVPSDFEPYRYSDFHQGERLASGYGGGIYVKTVPIQSLRFRLARGGFGQVRMTQLEVARPVKEIEGLPSVIGRDLIDQFRLIIDRSANLVLLERPTGHAP